MKILVAEDSATMRKVLQMTFDGENAEVTTVDNGDDALQLARQVLPDLIIADASMDGLDGYGIAEAIHGDATLGGIPVLVMASQQVPYDEDRGMSAGVADHIVKPFDTQALIDKAATLAGGVDAVFEKPSEHPDPVVTMSSVPVDALSSIPAAATGGPPPLPPIPSAPVASPVSSVPAAQPSSVPVATARSVTPTNGGGAAIDPSIGARLAELGLDEAQVQGVLRLSAEVVERVVWEVVPDLAETLIREEIRRLTGQ